MTNVDLTKTYPRSVHERYLGVAQLARAIDKGRATAHGNVGEYHYNCPMDQAVFAFLGVDADELLEVIKNAKGDADIEVYLRAFLDAKTEEEREQWSRQWVSRKPEGESLRFFLELRGKIAPERTDVTSWADLLDLDEERFVPRRQRAAA